MRNARLTGTVTASVKSASLTAVPLPIVDLEDGAGGVVSLGTVVADAVGAGPGDLVLIAEGIAARLSSRLSGAPIDTVAMAIVGTVSIGEVTRSRRNSNTTRKSWTWCRKLLPARVRSA